MVLHRTRSLLTMFARREPHTGSVTSFSSHSTHSSHSAGLSCGYRVRTRSRARGEPGERYGGINKLYLHRSPFLCKCGWLVVERLENDWQPRLFYNTNFITIHVGHTSTLSLKTHIRTTLIISFPLYSFDYFISTNELSSRLPKFDDWNGYIWNS